MKKVSYFMLGEQPRVNYNRLKNKQKKKCCSQNSPAECLNEGKIVKKTQSSLL